MKTLYRWISIMVLAALMLAGCSQAAPVAEEAPVDEAAPVEVAEDSSSSDETVAEDEVVEEEVVEEEVDDSAPAEGDEPASEEAAADETAAEEQPAVEVVPEVSILEENEKDCMVAGFEEIQRFPPVTESDWIQGSFDAPITILVYSDLQCPYCSLMDPQLELLLEAHPDDIRLVWRHFPLSYHENSMAASMAIEAAGLQDYDAFFEMKSRIFAFQSEWSELSAEDFNAWLEEQAGDMGLDVEQFSADLQNEALSEKIQKSYIDGANVVQVRYTPYVLIDGIPAEVYGPDLESAYLNAKSLQEYQFTECPEMTLVPDTDYKAIIKTDQGDITIDLYEDEAPLAVNSFIFLVENGWYDNNPFHRVIPDFVAQAGEPLGLGFGGPGYIYVNEIDENLKFDKEGVLGMANSGVDTNGSQFFITFGPFEQLDGNYTVFGQVIEGMDVARSLTARDPSSQEELPDPSMITSIEIVAE